MPTILRKSEFAALKGWSKAYVSKLVREQRLVLTPEGRVNLEASEALLAQTADPSKAAVADRHAADRVNRQVHAPPSPPADPAAGGGSFNAAKTKHQWALARLAELELGKAEQSLVPRDIAEQFAFTLGRATRDRVLGVITPLAPQLAGCSDAWECERLLDEALRRALEDAAQMAGQLVEEANDDSR